MVTIILTKDMELDITRFKVTMLSMASHPIYNSQTQIKNTQNSNITKHPQNLKKAHLLEVNTLVTYK